MDTSEYLVTFKNIVFWTQISLYIGTLISKSDPYEKVFCFVDFPYVYPK